MNCTVVYYDDEGTYKNGETEKAKPLIKYFQNKFDKTYLVSTRNWKKHPFSLLKRLVAYTKKSQYVFIILSINGAKLLGSFLTKYCAKKNIKVVYLMVGIGPVKLEFSEKAPHLMITEYFKKPEQWQESKLSFAKTFRRFDAVFVESETLKRVCETIYKANNVKILKNFRDAKDLIMPDQFVLSEEPRFIVFSRLNKSKGIHHLIAAANALNQKGLKYHIDLYGTIADDVKDLMNELPKNLTYRGAIDEDKTEILNAYDALIFPTLHWEGIPGTLVEASMADLPIISSDFTFAQDIVTNGVNGYIYEFGSVDGLVKAIEHAILNRNGLLEMRKEAIKVGQSYVTEKCLLALDRHIKDVK